MDTIEEIKSYCQIKNPAGAFMLCGEWGCGKTYLIDNIMPKVLENYIFIRVSLFGEKAVEEIHTEIKKKWILAWAEHTADAKALPAKPIKGIGNFLEKIILLL